MRSVVAALGIALLAGGCAAQQPLRGRVAVTSMGPRPLTTLVTDSTSPMVLEGPLEPELRQVNGAYVEVQGKRTETPPHGGIEVEHYVILEIEGEEPYVGRLDSTGTQLTTEDGSLLRLVGLPRPIHGAARIWVIGNRREDVLEVRAAGVLARD